MNPDDVFDLLVEANPVPDDGDIADGSVILLDVSGRDTMHTTELAARPNAPWWRRPVSLAAAGILVALVAVAAIAFRSSSEGEPLRTIDDPTTSVPDEPATDLVDPATRTATVEIAGSTHEFIGTDFCEIGEPGSDLVSEGNPAGRTVTASFRDDQGNVVSLSVADTQNIPSLTLDGTTWRVPDAPSVVDVTDDGAVWTGEMTSGGGVLEPVTISISCS